MKEEIFGPLLPMVNVNDVEEAVSFVNAREKPLALYCFSKQQDFIKLLRDRTSSGSFVANDVLMQAALPSLPFGGVGESGLGGNYHGKFGFEVFSHRKPVYNAPLAMEGFNTVRYPPYNSKKLSLVQWVGEQEVTLSQYLFKPIMWLYMLAVFVVRLALLPRSRPN